MAIFTAIAAATAWVTSAGVAIGLSAAAAAAIATVAVSTAISVGLTVAANYLARPKKPNVKVSVAEIQAVISETDAPRRVFVGQNLVGGVRAFFDVKAGTLTQVVVVAHGAITEFVELWIDNTPVTLRDNSAVLTWPYRTTESGEVIYVYIDNRTGAALGGDYSWLINNHLVWHTGRKLTNQATFLVNMIAPSAEDFSKVFPKSYNTDFQWIIKGQKIYDPRGGGTAYKDNAALVTAHYLTHPDGYKIAQADIDWTSVTAMANVASTSIPRKGGGTVESLRLWGYWTLDESPADVLDRMHGSSGIRAYEMQDGRLGLIGGNFGTPSCTLTAKDIRRIQTSEAISERAGYNVLRVFHMDAAQKYQVTEVDAWRDETRLAIEGEIVEEYHMEMCPSISQARRLAKQQISNDNRAKVEIVTNLVGLKARFPRLNGQRHTITLDYQPEDGSGRVIQGEYEVMDHEFDPINLECRIELERIDRASETWVPSIDEGDSPEAPPERVPSLPPTLSAVLAQRVVGSVVMIQVYAVPIPDRNDVRIRAQYQGPDGEWRDMRNTGYSALSDAVSDGVTYQVRAKFEGVFDRPDVWHPVGSIYTTANPDAPGSPSQLVLTNGPGRVHLKWQNPAGPFANLRIYRSAGTVYASAALIGQTGGASGQTSEFNDTSVVASSTYRYWVAAANGSGIEGPPAGPKTITTPDP